jgi:hypothetical protein
VNAVVSPAQSTLYDQVQNRMKGIGFANVQAFVVERFGAADWQHVRNALSARDATELAAVVAVGWYDVQLFARLLRAVDATLGGGDLQLLHQVGIYEAERDFNRALRLLLRVVSPMQVFRLERRLWTHFQDSGTWSFVEMPSGMRCTLADWAVDQALCIELGAYIARLFEFTGGKNVRVAHAGCRATGSAQCIFDVSWS